MMAKSKSKSGIKKAIAREPKNVLDLGPSNFPEFMDYKGVALLYFWGEHCGPCKVTTPMYSLTAKANKTVLFGKSNTSQDHTLATHLGIRRLPSLVVFYHGVLIYEGAMPPTTYKLNELIHQVKLMRASSVIASVIASTSEGGDPSAYAKEKVEEQRHDTTD